MPLRLLALAASALVVAHTAGAEPLAAADTPAEPQAETQPEAQADAPVADATLSGHCQPQDPELGWAALPKDLREVPVEEMIGQLLVVSFSGKTVDSPGVQAARKAIAASEIGGVLYFRHNVGSADELRAVNAAFAEAHPLPAMIAVDQEGGKVTRIKTSEGAPKTPGARDVAKGTAAEARAHYDAMAAALADLGFTANFGPVVDLRLNPDNPVIARFGRSYGADPAMVAEYAGTFIAAHRAAGVATALKHFPGHGSSRQDSHDGAIDLTATWSRVELVPFAALIEEDKADMVMVGHLDLAGVTGPGPLPASLSPNAIDGLLREAMCFAGVVVSDDLAMEAISARWDAPEATRLMIEAGGDVALLSMAPEKGAGQVGAIIEHLAEEAERSPAFKDRLRHAYARVVHHKLDTADRRSASLEGPGTPATRLATAR